MWKSQTVVALIAIAASVTIGSAASQQNQNPAEPPAEPEQKASTDPPPPTAEELLEKMNEQESGSAKTPPATDEPAAGSSAQNTPTTAEELLRAMQEQKPAPRAVTPWSMEDGTAEGGRPGRLMPEGARVVRRAGRLIREGDWWTFAFESDHPDHPEPRLGVLPNLVLETMARTVESGSAGVVWVVSGEVTEYRNRNFVLIRDAQRRSDGGNLRP